MIAHVIPLTRLPAHCTFFDYLIPEGMEVAVGDLVLISFRRKILYGIVRSKSEESRHKKLAPLKKHLQKNVLSENDFERLEKIADALHQSLATLLHCAIPKHIGAPLPPTPYPLPPAPSVRISPEELPILKELCAFIEAHPEHAALQGDAETGIALAHILIKRLKKNEQLLLLVPRDRDAEMIRSLLAHEALAVVTGSTSEQHRVNIFSRWKEGSLHVLVGTKQVALWNASALRYVLVLHAGNDEYAHARRNPKYDPREAAKLLAQQHCASYVSIDTLPRIEDCPSQHYCVPFFIPDPQSLEPLARFIPLASRTEKTGHPLITLSLQAAIENTSQNQKRVLLFFNRKGAAKRLQCAACDYVPLCGTCGNIPTVRAEDLACDRCGTEMWVPKVCPKCQQARLKFVGVGGEKVVSDLKKLFPNLSIGFVEKGSDGAWKNANIVVATEHVFANLITPFTRYGFGLIADLMADLPVSGINFRATEHTSRQLLRLMFLAKREKAPCLIQTWIPERLPSLIAPQFVIEEELRIRTNYKLPPFGNIYTTKTTTLRNPQTLPQEPFVYDGAYGESVKL